jgi:hypothetical protein
MGTSSTATTSGGPKLWILAAFAANSSSSWGFWMDPPEAQASTDIEFAANGESGFIRSESLHALETEALDLAPR